MKYLLRFAKHTTQFVCRILYRLNQHTLRATSLVEAALSMVVVGIMITGLWVTFTTVMQHVNERRTKRYLDEISYAAAQYAYQHGYLPMPEGQDPPQYGNPDTWLTTLTLRGKVPWRELGMSHKPVVNGKEFTWVVSVTAIQRPGWQYYQADRMLHLLPTFRPNRNNNYATFARPGWDGRCGKWWWKDADPRDHQHHCKYTIQTRSDCIPSQAPRFVQLTPRPPQSGSLSSAVFLDILRIYELEMEIGLHSMGKVAAYKDTYSPLASYVGYVLTSNPKDLVTAAKLSRLERMVWFDEPVLAITYNSQQPDSENQLAVEITPHTLVWTRFCLLALVKFYDTTFYTHPGYCWRVVDPAKNAWLKAQTIPYQLDVTPLKPITKHTILHLSW